MTTLVVSDMHLAHRSHRWLLSEPEAREALAAAAEGADRLVLLGDVLELRESPVREVVEAATPTLEALGRAMAGREIVIVPGNHDHQLADPLLDELRVDGSLAALGLADGMPAPDTGLTGRVARLLAPAEVRLSYPGVWVRDDVYAMHGHHLDLHNTIPTLEVLSVGAAARAVGGLPRGRRTPADYEAAMEPVYALTYALAQAPGPAARTIRGKTTLEAWKRLNGAGARDAGPARRLAALALGRVLFPGAVAVINRAGLGPFETDLSAAALRDAGLRGIGAAIEALGVEADHVIFGHTHRSGPHPGDRGWELPGGTRLINGGSWIHEPAFLGTDPRSSPYWPGSCVVIEDSGPPELRRLVT